jgi:ABC-2 type transport system ATP-binding protein
MIEVRNLTKYYPGITAVNNISFDIAKGDIVGFLGPNGAGKTTTMRILTTFIPPSSGKATIAGHDVVTDSLNVRKLIGYMPETVPLYTEMRVNEYLKFRSKIKGVPAKERTARLNEVIESCRLKDVERTIIGHLSKGYRQRVGLAEAIINNPSILILDEPTIGLDPVQIRQTRSLIKELGRDRTIIISTHILPEVEMICNRVIIIAQGKIVAMDTTGQGKQQKEIRLELKGPGPAIKQVLEKISGVKEILWQEKDNVNLFRITSDEDLRETIAREMMQYNWIIRELKLVQVSLEDLFIKVTARE